MRHAPRRRWCTPRASTAEISAAPARPSAGRLRRRILPRSTNGMSPHRRSSAGQHVPAVARLVIFGDDRWSTLLVDARFNGCARSAGASCRHRAGAAGDRVVAKAAARRAARRSRLRASPGRRRQTTRTASCARSAVEQACACRAPGPAGSREQPAARDAEPDLQQSATPVVAARDS